MKPSTFGTLFALATASVARLEPRQECSSENSCYNAVFGDRSFERVVRGIEDCEDFLTTSVIWHPMYVVHRPMIFPKIAGGPVTPSETPAPMSTVAQGNRIMARQALPTDFSTTTVLGMLPASVTQACNTAAYSSACGCANIAADVVTYLGSTVTNTATTTITAVVTTGSFCPSGSLSSESLISATSSVSGSGPSSTESRSRVSLSMSSFSLNATVTSLSDSGTSSTAPSSPLDSSVSASATGNFNSSIVTATTSILSSASLSSANVTSMELTSSPSSSSNQTSMVPTSSSDVTSMEPTSSLNVTSIVPTSSASGSLNITSMGPTSTLNVTSIAPTSSSSMGVNSSSAISESSLPGTSSSVVSLTSSSATVSSSSIISSNMTLSQGSSSIVPTSSSISIGPSSSLSLSSVTATLSETLSSGVSSLGTVSATSSTQVTSSTGSTSSATPSPPPCEGVGVQQCDGVCRDTTGDTLNCGRCGNACTSGRQCINGVCASRPCDSSCNFDRLCGPGASGSRRCICATTIEGNGVCFDKNAFSCGDVSLVRCQKSVFGPDGCPVGSVCVRNVCNCGVLPGSGICVATTGCGESGTNVMGSLVRIGEMEKRRRTVRGLGK